MTQNEWVYPGPGIHQEERKELAETEKERVWEERKTGELLSNDVEV
jgi:hypothetical protein